MQRIIQDNQNEAENLPLIESFKKISNTSMQEVGAHIDHVVSWPYFLSFLLYSIDVFFVWKDRFRIKQRRRPYCCKGRH